jgi:hypothetical protein
MPLAFNPTVQAMITQLPEGAIDAALARASQRCDTFCQKRLQAPGNTTLLASVSATATTISVVSSLTLDNLSEQAVIINPGGGNQETLLINPGGVNVTAWVYPYPATLALHEACVYGHSAGEPVSFVYKEVTEAGSSSSSDPYTEALQTQAMQLALAHLPPATTALTRVVFLKSFPIIKLYEIEHAFSFVNQFNMIDLSIESVVHAEGWYRMNVGTVILREGLMRTTYTGGFEVIPDDVKVACSYYLAEQLMMQINPFGLQQLTMGKRTQKWSTMRPKNFLAEQAEDILRRYKRIM